MSSHRPARTLGRVVVRPVDAVRSATPARRPHPRRSSSPTADDLSGTAGDRRRIVRPGTRSGHGPALGGSDRRPSHRRSRSAASARAVVAGRLVDGRPRRWCLRRGGPDRGSPRGTSRWPPGRGGACCCIFVPVVAASCGSPSGTTRSDERPDGTTAATSSRTVARDRYTSIGGARLLLWTVDTSRVRTASEQELAGAANARSSSRRGAGAPPACQGGRGRGRADNAELSRASVAACRLSRAHRTAAAPTPAVAQHNPKNVAPRNRRPPWFDVGKPGSTPTTAGHARTPRHPHPAAPAPRRAAYP